MGLTITVKQVRDAATIAVQVIKEEINGFNKKDIYPYPISVTILKNLSKFAAITAVVLLVFQKFALTVLLVAITAVAKFAEREIKKLVKKNDQQFDEINLVKNKKEELEHLLRCASEHNAKLSTNREESEKAKQAIEQQLLLAKNELQSLQNLISVITDGTATRVAKKLAAFARSLMPKAEQAKQPANKPIPDPNPSQRLIDLLGEMDNDVEASIRLNTERNKFVQTVGEKLRALNEQISKFEQEKGELRKTQEGKIRELISSKERDVKAATEKLNAQIAKLEAERNQLNAVVAKHESESRQLRLDVPALKLRVESLTTSVQERKARLAESRAATQEVTRELGTLKNDVRVAADSLTDNARSFLEQFNLNGDKAVLERMLPPKSATILQNTSTYISKIQEGVQFYQGLIKVLQKKREDVIAQSQVLRQANDEKHEQIQKMKTELDQLRAAKSQASASAVQAVVGSFLPVFEGAA